MTDTDVNAGHDLPDAPPHIDYVGTPPGALPEELGGAAALVGNREAEGGIPDEAKPYDPKPHEVPGEANADYTSTPSVETTDQVAVEDSKPARRSRNK